MKAMAFMARTVAIAVREVENSAMALNPHAIKIEASSHCQLRCPSCPTTEGAIDAAVGKGFLRPDDFRRLLDANPSLAVVELSNYGEVFLNPRLMEILEIAHARSVEITIANGANLNNVRPEVLEGLVKYGLRQLNCSIDGATQATYEIYRVRGRLDRVLENIRAINHWKGVYGSPYPRLNWQFIVFGHNQHELEAARALAKSLDMTFAPKLSWDSDLPPPDPALARAVLGAASREEFRKDTGRDYMQGLCHQLWHAPQINWDGKVLGCCRNFWGDFGGNAFRDGLRASVNTERIIHARRMLTGRAPPREDVPCSTCSIYEDMRANGRFLNGARMRLGVARRTLRATIRTLARAANRMAPSFGRPGRVPPSAG